MANIQDILFIFVQGFSGAVAGYITNKYAVNMIFKEYTPLKIGGAVKKNKVKFIEEVSELVEKDIINAHTLTGSIKSEEFAKVVESACMDFIQNSLKDAFKDKKISEIPEIKKSAEQSVVFIEQNIQEELPKVIDNFANKIDLKSILDDKQLDNMSEKIIDIALEVLEEDKKLEEFLACLYDENKELTLKDILSEDAKKQLQAKIASALNESINQILDDKEKCLALIEKIYDLLDVKQIIDDLEIKLGQKTVREILGQEGIENLGVLLFKYAKELLENSDNKDKIKAVISELIESAKNVDLTLIEVLPPDLAAALVVYIRENISKIAPQIFNWLYENKDDIDTMINTAAMESVEKIEDPATQGLISKFEGMLPILSQTLKIVDRASDMIMEYELTEEHASKIYNLIVDFLEKTSLSDLIEFVQDKLHMTEDDICDKAIELFDKNKVSVINKLILSFADKRLSQIIKLNLEGLFKEKAIPAIYKYLKSKKQDINSYLDEFIKNKLGEILATDLSNLIGQSKVVQFSKMLPKWISIYIVNNKEICKKYLKNIVSNILATVDTETLILENKEDIILVAGSKFSSIKKSLFDALKNKEVNDVFSFIRDEEQFGKAISEKINKGIENNSEKLFENRVKQIIYSNLIKLDEDEICNIAQSFMGKQLKPLSYFGAFLGTIVGLTFGFVINGTVNKFGFYNGYANTIIACVLMGLVGILTNIIALWMIFHPYKKNRFIAKIPIFRIFAEGYIPAHKNSFATGMAYFIDNELLKGKRVESLFEENKDNFSKGIFDFVSKNNFKVLVDLAKEKKKEISEFLCRFLISKCENNKMKIAKYVSNVVVNLEMDEILSKKTVISRSESVLLSLDKFNDKVIEFAQAKIDKHQAINEVLPENIVRNINSDIDKFIENGLKSSVENMITEEFVKKMILSNKELYLSFTDKSIHEFIGDEGVQRIKAMASENLNSYIMAKLPNLTHEMFDNFLGNNFAEDDNIAALFDGQLKMTLDKRLYYIISSLLQKLCEFIQSNEDKAVELVINIVRGQLNFFVKLAYEFANGDSLVKLVVENIVETKLERFLDDSMYSTTKAISIILNSVIYPTTFGELGLKLDEVNTGLVTNKLFKEIEGNEALFEKIDAVAIDVIDQMKFIKVSEVLENSNIKDLEGAYDLLGAEVGFVVNKLVENYNYEEAKINKFVTSYIYENITASLLDRELEEFVDVDEVITNAINTVLDKLNSSENTRNMLLEVLGKVYDEKIESMMIEELLLEDELALSIDSYLDKIFNDLDFKANNQYICDKVVFNFIESEFRFIDYATMEFVGRNIIDALLATAVGYTVDALKALNLKTITTEQVELMEAREIHMLFKAFAGDFFVKLYMYGSVGCVFGLNLYLSILLGILDLIYSKKVDEIEISSSNIFKE